MSVASVCELLDATPRSFTSEELLQHASWRGIAGAIRRGAITKVVPEQYASTLHADAWTVRLHAATAWSPEAVVTGPSAVRLWGHVALADDVVHLAVPRAESRRWPDWMSVRRTDLDLPTVRLGRYRVHEPHVATALAVAMSPRRDREELLYSSVRLGLVRPDQLLLATESFPRLVDRRAMRRVLSAIDFGAESFLEERAWATVLTGRRLASLIPQHRVSVAGNTFRLDAFDARTATALEFDGARWHGGERRVDDVRRDALLAAIGMQTIRFAYADVMGRPKWCRELALEVLASREPGETETESAVC